MAKDFFEELGEAITKTAREIGGRAEDVYKRQGFDIKILFLTIFKGFINKNAY